MQQMQANFYYSDSLDALGGTNDYELNVSAGIDSESALFDAFAVAGRFPNYFGKNWDALLDCLRDLSWIENTTILIRHNDLPLREDRALCRIYLDVLQAALIDWSEVRYDADGSPGTWLFIQHTIKVVFPAEIRSEVERFLSEN